MEKGMLNNKLIFDLGFHNGDDTDFYLKKGFKVVALEANPDLIETGKERFQDYIISGQLILLHKAIHFFMGQDSFYIHQTNINYSSCFKELVEIDKTISKKIDIETITFDKLCNNYGVPYYAKVDVEGCDIFVAEKISKMEIKPSYVSFELCKKDYSYIFAYLLLSGYTKFQLINQVHNPIRKLPLLQKEGNSIDYTFSEHSSGLFGKDLQDKMWLTYEEMLLHYMKYRELKQLDNQELTFGWIDLHAKN